VLIVAVAALSQLKKSKHTGIYRRRQLMTANEVEFFRRLVAALPEHYIFPQVSMQALIEAASGDKKQAHSDRLRIAQQRADYVICNHACDVVAVVELDDRTHVAAKDQLRDSRLEQAGIRTIRFQSRNKPTMEAIREAVLPTLAPEPATVKNIAPPTSATSDLIAH
jgi:rRNA-processing protein FCF1